MTISDRDRRALLILGPAVVLFGLFYWYSNYTPSSGANGSKDVPGESVAGAEKRLANLRKEAATLPGKQGVLQQVSSELAVREKGLLAGDTAEQAQAQLLQVIKRVATQQTPPLETGQVELGRAKSFGDYGQVSVSITVTCRIDELVNFLAALSAQPELAATEEIRFGNSNPRQKTIPIRLTITGLVARRLIPKQKNYQEF